MEDLQLWKLLFSADASEDIAKLAENYQSKHIGYKPEVYSDKNELIVLPLPVEDSWFYIERQENSHLALSIQYPGKLYDLTIAGDVQNFILFSDYSNPKILKVHITLADGIRLSEIIHL
jgi:hypothetical protein